MSTVVNPLSSSPTCCRFFPARLAQLPYGLDSNVTQLFANLLNKPSVFYYFANNYCILKFSFNKIIIIVLVLLYMVMIVSFGNSSTASRSNDP